jgi:hypothetical protein
VRYYLPNAPSVQYNAVHGIVVVAVAFTSGTENRRIQRMGGEAVGQQFVLKARLDYEVGRPIASGTKHASGSVHGVIPLVLNM